MSVERITEGQIVRKIVREEVVVPYGTREIITNIRTGLNKSSRTLTNRQRKNLREKNRLEGRPRRI